MRRFLSLAVLLTASTMLVACGSSDLPVVEVGRDNVVVRESSLVRIAAGTIVEDQDGNGVIHVGADGVVLVFEAAAELLGAPGGAEWETLTGVGIRVEGRRDVTVRGAHLHRFKIGIWATEADGLVIDACDVSGGFAQRLGSNAEAEDPEDWLSPHENDSGEWAAKYGAGILIENSANVTVRNCFARRRQNGLLLDRVETSRVYDNDFSFLSGWGIAMWRSSHNVLSRNAVDFCVRGYSHGVYNRGQDSAGILMFEQCNDNVIAENSATHGGDGLFGFGGQESLAGTGRTGNNRNRILGNDFSYAAAHGLEMTFSFDSTISGNRFLGNAICGIWGGYSQSTLVEGNHFEANGAAGYGLERGGVNIEHGAHNVIRDNRFRANVAGVHLWDDDDESLLAEPWSRANHLGSVGNVVTGNRFEGDRVALHLRDTAERAVVFDNAFVDVGTEVEATAGAQPRGVSLDHVGPPTAGRPIAGPEHAIHGERRPVGARAALAGREHIVMGRYFPVEPEVPGAPAPEPR